MLLFYCYVQKQVFLKLLTLCTFLYVTKGLYSSYIIHFLSAESLELRAYEIMALIKLHYHFSFNTILTTYLFRSRISLSYTQ